MTSAGLASAVRTPFDLHHGALAGWHPAELLATVLHAALDRAGRAADALDAVVVGCAEPVGGQSGNVARAAALAAGWPDTVAALTVDAGGAAGLVALHQAVALVAGGLARTVVAAAVDVGSTVPAGAASMGRHPYGKPWGAQATARSGAAGLVPPAVAAEGIAERYGLTRAELHAWATTSWARAEAADRSGRRAAALVATATRVGDDPLPRVAGRGRRTEPPLRRDGLLLRPRLDPGGAPSLVRPDGVVDAVSVARAVDGAAAVVVVAADEPGAVTVVRSIVVGGARVDDRVASAAAVVGRAVAAAAPADPVWLLDETFATDALALTRLLGLDAARVNPDGGALALGDSGAVRGLAAVVDAVAAPAGGPSPSSSGDVMVEAGDDRLRAACVLGARS